MARKPVSPAHFRRQDELLDELRRLSAEVASVKATASQSGAKGARATLRLGVLCNELAELVEAINGELHVLQEASDRLVAHRSAATAYARNGGASGGRGRLSRAFHGLTRSSGG